ncbi:MAG: hypothetical protein KGJ86_06940, partial [Chloroflexota bacterium]|nr:hypothetical protein [Chloroflexota bacterium]
MAASALFDTTRLAFAPPDDEDLEAAAAWSWLSSQAGVQAVRVAADSFHQLLRETQVLWWHRGSAVPEPSGEVLGQLGRWLQDGGRLWLTLQAVALLLPLGLEERLPDRLGRFAWKRGEGEIAALEGERRGLLGFGSHPIFAGLHGGAFLLSPAAGRSYPEAVYTGPTEGWLVAGEWQYLGVDAQRKLALEYRLGRGRVLAVGAHVLFAEPENRFRAQLERFARNCLAYLSGSPSGAPPHWPSTATAGVVRRRRPEPSPAAADKGRPAPSEVEGVRAPAAATLPSSPSLSSAGAADAQFDVAGGRAIVVGRERSGVSEVWSLPIRLARNLRSQFVGGGGPRGSLALWERAGAREFRRLPSHVERELDVDRDIRALQVVRAGAAEASITYRILAGRVSQLRVGFEVDLRYFWPYPEGVLGRPSVEEWGGGTLGLTDAEGTAWGSVIAEPAYDQLRVRRRKSGAAAVRLTFESPISEVTLRFRGPAGAGPTSGATPGPP